MAAGSTAERVAGSDRQAASDADEQLMSHSPATASSNHESGRSPGRRGGWRALITLGLTGGAWHRVTGRHRLVLTTSAAIVGAQALLATAGVLSARALGPDGKGLTSAIFVWMTLLAWAGLLGINQALSVRVAANPKSNIQEALGSGVLGSLILGTIVTLVALAFVPAALAHLGPDAKTLATVALMTIPLIMLADVLMWLNVGLGRVQRANVARLMSPSLMVAFTAVLVVLGGLTPTSFVVITLVANTLSLPVLAVGLPWRGLVMSLRGVYQELRFGIRVHLTGLLGLANLRLDVLLMSGAGVVSASQLGYYGVANNVMIPVSSLAAAAAILITPAVARLGGDEAPVGQQVAFIRREARRYLWLAIAGGIGLALVSPILIPIVFGSTFRPAIVLVWILIPGFIARSFTAILLSGTVGMRRSWVGNAAEGAGIVVTIALLPFLLPLYGVIGASIVSTASYTCAAIVAWLSILSIRQPGDEGNQRAVSGGWRQALHFDRIFGR